MATHTPRRSVWQYMSIGHAEIPSRPLAFGTVILLVLMVFAAITETNGPRSLPAPSSPVAPSPLGDGRFLVYPNSAHVQQRVPYRFTISTRCGLSYPLLVDFDGSFWNPVNAGGDANAPAGYGQPSDSGVIILDSATQAEYRSRTGQVLQLNRRSGPVTAAMCR